MTFKYSKFLNSSENSLFTIKADKIMSGRAVNKAGKTRARIV